MSAAYAGFSSDHSEADLERVRDWRRACVHAREALLETMKDPGAFERKWLKEEANYWLREQRGAQLVLDHLEGKNGRFTVPPELKSHVAHAQALLEAR